MGAEADGNEILIFFFAPLELLGSCGFIEDVELFEAEDVEQPDFMAPGTCEKTGFSSV